MEGLGATPSMYSLFQNIIPALLLNKLHVVARDRLQILGYETSLR